MVAGTSHTQICITETVSFHEFANHILFRVMGHIHWKHIKSTVWPKRSVRNVNTVKWRDKSLGQIRASAQVQKQQRQVCDQTGMVKLTELVLGVIQFRKNEYLILCFYVENDLIFTLLLIDILLRRRIIGIKHIR